MILYLLKIRIKSRHQSSKFYLVFIRYDPSKEAVEAITGWFCQFPNGLRTLGCCVHVASIVYYLCNGRFQSRLLRPADKLSKLFSLAPIVFNDESDDE